MSSASLETAASKLLAAFGVKAIWDMYLTATAAYDKGEPKLAATLIDLAEAAERCWMHRYPSAHLIDTTTWPR